MGFFTGAVIYGLAYPYVFPKIAEIGKVGSVVIPDLWKLNPYLSVLLFALVSLLLFYAIDRASLHRSEKKDETK